MSDPIYQRPLEYGEGSLDWLPQDPYEQTTKTNDPVKQVPDHYRDQESNEPILFRFLNSGWPILAAIYGGIISGGRD